MFFYLEEYSQMLSNKSSRNRKKKRLHELFRPPVDILHEGDFQSVSSWGLPPWIQTS